MNRNDLIMEYRRRKSNRLKHFSRKEKAEIYNAVVDSYRKKNVYEFYSVCMEEMGELTQKISKHLRGKIGDNDVEILEEIADVQICLETLKVFMNTDPEDMDYVEDVKLNRLKERHMKNWIPKLWQFISEGYIMDLEYISS